MKRNPYLNRSMIRDVGAFYGRQREIERVLARVGAHPPQSVAIVGERRIGKSSLLWHISQQEIYERYLESPERYIFLLLDFQGQQHLDVEGFCAVFGQHLRMAVGSRLEIPELHDFAELERVVRAMEKADLHLICLLDEFETVTRNPNFGSPFFGLLRSLANAYPVAFVTASGRDLQSMCHTREIAESPFFNIFATVHLGPLLEGEARQLICEPSAAAGLPLAPYADQILNLSGRLPFFVQMACSATFECLLEGGQPLSVGAVEARFCEEATSHFHYLWERLDEKQQEVIQRLIAGADLEPEETSILHSLEKEGYIERRGSQNRLFSRAFERFLKQTVPEIEALRWEVKPPPPSRQLKRREMDQVTPIPPGACPFPEIIGESVAIRQVFALMEKAIATDVTVLLMGETGTGKELLARTIHRHSERKDHPFIAVNCGAIPEHLQESELFGHRKGAFTDAIADRVGLFEAAHKGTLFLDEIDETSAATQVKLLRVLQEGEIRRVGETDVRKVDVRLICATNRNLEEAVVQGRFREDLYYRLYVLVLPLPALRERQEDIPLLLEHFLQGYEGGIDETAVTLLKAYDWPGNIRELENQISSAKVLAAGTCIEPEHLWPRVRTGQPMSSCGSTVSIKMEVPEGLTLKESREWFERSFIEYSLKVYRWDIDAAAKRLGLSRSHLYGLIRQLGLIKEEQERERGKGET